MSLFIICLITFGQDKNEIITDIDGNVYHTVIIGTQTWMVEDLKVTKYRNGAPLKAGSYYWYNDNISSKDTYGALYDWYCVDNGPLAPKGWHVPSDKEWQLLIDYLGGEKIAGGKLKETGTDHWNSPNTGADNSSGFTALPGGARFYERGFVGIGYNALWWTSTKINFNKSMAVVTMYNSSEIAINKTDTLRGYSVRCIKD